MAEFRSREVPMWEKLARMVGLSDDQIQEYELKQMLEKNKYGKEETAFRAHLDQGGSILDAPLPGANPEVPDLGTGMAGVVMAGGGQALPPGIGPRVPKIRPATPRRGGAPRPSTDLKPGETFYSQLRRTVDTPHVQEKQTAEQWLRFLRKGNRKVHEDELKDTGLSDMLKAKGNSRVTKDEIRQHLDANEIKIEVVTRGHDPSLKVRFDELTRRADSGERLTTSEQAELSHLTFQSEGSPTKFPTQTLPGAENYREVLLKINGPGVEPYEGGHFGKEGDIHLRLSDRTVGGKKTLLVEEIQSDRAQKGRSEGFRGPVDDRELKAAADRASSDLRAAETAYFADSTNPILSHLESLQQARDRAQVVRNDAMRMLDSARSGVPSAPFVEKTESWTKLGLKKVLKMAADEGYDKVGIVRGQENAAHYDLSKQISRITFDDNNSGGIGKPDMSGPPGRGLLKAYDLNGKEVISKHLNDPSQIADHVGKDVASKLMASKPSESRSGGLGARRKELSGLDLSVGGEGMKAFYDQIVPQQLNKLGKEFGVKVEIEGGRLEEFLPGKKGTPIHTFDIPNSMKEKVKMKGFPLVSSSLYNLVDRRA